MERDPWTGQISAVDPNVIEEPSGFIDRYFKWSTQKTNIIQRPPAGSVDLNLATRAQRPPPARGASRVFGGDGVQPAEQVVTFGISEEGVKAAIEAMEGLLTANPAITISAMLSGLAALGYGVTMEILDYMMQVSVADPEIMTDAAWDSLLKQMRAQNNQVEPGLSQAEGYRQLREQTAL